MAPSAQAKGKAIKKATNNDNKTTTVPYLWRFLPRGLGGSAPSIILAGKNQCQPVLQPRGSAHSLEGPNRRHWVFLTSVLVGKIWLRSIVQISLREVEKFKRRPDQVIFRGATGLFVTGWD